MRGAAGYAYAYPIPVHHREQLWLGRATEGAPVFSP